MKHLPRGWWKCPQRLRLAACRHKGRVLFYPWQQRLHNDYRPNMDTLTPVERGKRMSLIRSKNTKPEMRVRKLVHAMGYRYRLHGKDLPGKPDMVFKSRRKVIFVHGCFWHRHPDPNCKLARLPKSRKEFWGPKLSGNRERDERANQALQQAGWDVLVVWECESANLEQLENTLRAFLEGKKENHAGH